MGIDDLVGEFLKLKVLCDADAKGFDAVGSLGGKSSSGGKGTR
mgnify:CR=1 FL=1